MQDFSPVVHADVWDCEGFAAKSPKNETLTRFCVSSTTQSKQCEGFAGAK
jgi:hypothetical protein